MVYRCFNILSDNMKILNSNMTFLWNVIRQACKETKSFKATKNKALC